jgi:hypothetical protein
VRSVADFHAAALQRVAGFVTSWAGYDNENRPRRRYDGVRHRVDLAGFAVSGRVARLIHRLIGLRP